MAQDQDQISKLERKSKLPALEAYAGYYAPAE
jgi:hypothetical protein